jgi:outer membrane biosynthesis protein TonB
VNQRRDPRSISNYFLPALSMLFVAAVGCAGQTPTAHDARAAGYWTFRLPETRSPYAGLAIADTQGQPTALGLVDDALASTAAKVETPAAQKPAPRPRPVVAEAPKPQPAPQPEAATPPQLPAAVQAEPEQLALNTPPVTNAGEEQRYSQREQQSQQQRNFRGGDAIVISASALVIILLVVILILLLT